MTVHSLRVLSRAEAIPRSVFSYGFAMSMTSGEVTARPGTRVEY